MKKGELPSLLFRKPLLQFLAVLLFLHGFAVHAGLWVTGYYPGWEQAGMPASNIDFTTVTHVIHSLVTVNPDGSLNSRINYVTSSNSADLISCAHAAGCKALICVGGSITDPSSEDNFLGATSSSNLQAFINNLTNFVANRGYDGVDLDWEPFYSSDIPQFTNFVIALRSALNALAPYKPLTAAVGAYPPYGDSPTAQYEMFAEMQSQFDQLNIMTYDLAGPWPGWVTWFNSPIYDGDYYLPSYGPLVPSVDGSVSNYLGNGVAPGKLGVGIAFYGYAWTGGSGVWQPRQSWATNNVPTATQETYQTIMTSYYHSYLCHWDTNAQAAYLSITNPVASNDMFISYDDQRTCQSKISYVRNHNLGGVMIWEIAQDYSPTAPAGQRAPLLQAINQGLATPYFTGVQTSGGKVILSFQGLPLGDYCVQWASNLTAGAWPTLVLTNNAGPAGMLQITDSILSGQTRFYRVKTPP
ncbi:MAG: glycoside hydrolase family 18 protein [Verrucomicrobiota bacterium]|jgi:chitinase